MQKLFAALRDLHPGYVVADVRFLADAASDAPCEKTAEQLDSGFVSAVGLAQDLDLKTLN